MLLAGMYFILQTAAAADLGSDRKVYFWPMRDALDHYLAEQITQEGVFQVVVDPKLADAVLTDRIDNKFLAGMNELFPLPKPEQADDSAKQEAEEPDPDTLYRPQQPPNRSTARSKGTLFLVDVKSRQVLWSTYLKEFYPSPNQLHKQARNVVARLKKQIASSME